MVPFIEFVDRVDVVEVRRLPQSANVFHLFLSHSQTGLSQKYFSTYVAPATMQLLQRGGEREIHLITIGPNSVAAHILSHQPTHLVTGVRLLDSGELACGLPRRLTASKRWLTAWALACGVAAIASAILGHAWSTLMLAAIATESFSISSALPGKALWGEND